MFNVSNPPDKLRSYEDAVAYFGTLHEFAPRTGRDRFRALLALLGNPQDRLRCLHVAGTNGKGSTVTFLASVLREAGYRVGSYLSPFVWDVRERWQINDEVIGREELLRQVNAIRPAIDAVAATAHGKITEFEMKTAIAFRWFAEQNVDFAVIEVGIGGRMDSTNVIPPPLVSLITSIGLDHQSLLGDTRAKIAAEKAGIIKQGSLACVTAVTDDEALSVIRKKAKFESVPLIVAGDAEAAAMDALSLSLHGDFQRRNAACAAAALRVLRDAGAAQIEESVLRHGLEKATLPGRFQIEEAAPGVPLVLDVAHNADAARVLAQALRTTFSPARKATLIVGMSKSHDPLPFLTELAPLTRRVIATEPRFRPRPANLIAEAAETLRLPVTKSPDVDASLKEATATVVQDGDGYVVVTGSFYTVGDIPIIKQYNCNKKP